jgi:Icc protein
MNKKPLVFAHIGDLHITKAQDPNYLDFLAIVAQLEAECKEQLDFVVLPGDNADNGLVAQYRLVATALKMLSAPVYIIPGDHDREPGSLANLYKGLSVDPLPQSLLVQDIRCLFLDLIGPGQGGPDFRLADTQLHWLESEFAGAKDRKEEIIIFMHTYPDDLKDEHEKRSLNVLIRQHDVLLVDMGHTHYNELANDGAVIYAATRSTGQIEEGPVGYSLVAADEGVVSWRFKALQDPFPFVLITSPADYRLVRRKDQLVSREMEVHAIVFGASTIVRVNCSGSQDAWVPMTWASGYWKATIAVPPGELFPLTVEAVDERGRPGRHMITVGTPSYKLPARVKNGSDADSIGAWPDNGIFGTQLGPNRNSKPWHQ